MALLGPLPTAAFLMNNFEFTRMVFILLVASVGLVNCAIIIIVVIINVILLHTVLTEDVILGKLSTMLATFSSSPTMANFDVTMSFSVGKRNDKKRHYT